MSRCEPLGRFDIFVSDRHTFGTDGVLLADFAAPKPNTHVCELGAGCGVISLLWCKKTKGLRIDAVELMPEACELLRRSVLHNGLQENIEVHRADLRALRDVLPGSSYTLVACNPPYYAQHAGLPSRDPARAAARQETACTLEQAARAAARLLKPAGRFCVCYPPARLAALFSAMQAVGIEPKRLRLVSLDATRAPYLALVEGRRSGKPGLSVLPTLLLRDAQGEETEEVRTIYGDYRTERRGGI